MSEFKVIEIKQSVYNNNNNQANLLRKKLSNEKVFLLNLMSSPGSGKTSVLIKTIEALKNKLKIGIIEADIDSDVDAQTISKTGARVIQVNTGGMCHLTAGMTQEALENLGTTELDLVVLENIGNLVCTAEFDTGAAKNAMILSVPEGDDKPLKYPAMFKLVDVVLVNKIDVLPYFNFNMQRFTEYVKKLNPNIEIIPMSAITGEGITDWVVWLNKEIINWKR